MKSLTHELDQFKESLSYLCLPSIVVASLPLTQEIVGSNRSTAKLLNETKIVTEVSEFTENI